MNPDDSHLGGGSSAQIPSPAETTSLGPVTKAVEPDGSASIGQVLDNRYRIVAKLGEGGMGEVYAAEHVHIEKRVAIKLLRGEILSNQEAVSRFHQEARSASSIGHENIIAIEDFGKLPDGRVYLCMELLDGKPLNELIKEPIAPERLLDILIQTCHGLSAAHRKGIVHRDMKPENIFVTRGPDGRDVPKLLDFGIAKVQGTDGNNNLTRTGMIFGTPFYMAPEQAMGEGVDARADIYAMGVIMYEMFTGSIPFEGESFMGILTKHITAEPEPPSQRAMRLGRALLPGMEPIIQRAMRKHPDGRYQTMDELTSALVSLRRSLVGPGMSSYMEAHEVQASAVMSTLGASSSALAPDLAAMSHVMASPPPGLVNPYATTSPSMLGAAYVPQDSLAGSSVAVPRNSKAGLIGAIIAVVVVVGGLTAFALMPSKSANRSADVQDTGTGTTGQTGAGTAGQAGAATAGQAGAGATVDTPVTTDRDPEPIRVVIGDDPSNTTVITAAPVRVLVISNPLGATVARDGKKLGTAPLDVEVLPGEPVTVTVSARRHQDAELVLDGKQERVMVELKKERRGSAAGASTRGDGEDSKNTRDEKAGNLGLDLE